MEININDDVAKMVGSMQLELLRLQAVVRALEGKIKEMETSDHAPGCIANGQPAAIN